MAKPRLLCRPAECDKQFDEINNKLVKFDNAIFGNDELQIDGLVKMVKEMHSFFYSSNAIIKVVRNAFLALAFLSTLIYGLIQLFKEFKK